jgi:tetratricopeptide (TPR) repeat protein
MIRLLCRWAGLWAFAVLVAAAPRYARGEEEARWPRRDRDRRPGDRADPRKKRDPRARGGAGARPKPGAKGGPAAGKRPGAKKPPAEKPAPPEGGGGNGGNGGEGGEGEDGEEAGPEEFTDDLIVLKSGLALEGKVVEETEDSIKVLVDYGVFWIERFRIDSIEFNLTSRLKEIAEDDYVARYELAARAVEMGQSGQAKPVLEEVLGKPGVPADIYRILADIYEAEGDLEKALDLLRRYAMTRHDDEELKARIAELAEQLKPKEGAPAAGPEAGPAAAANEGLETGGSWSVLNWGNPATATLKDLDGNNALMVEVPAGGKEPKAAIGRSLRTDMSGNSRLTFRAFNAEKKNVSLAVAIITARDFYESREIPLRPDWNLGLSIDLRAKDFKCEKTDWQFKAGIDGLDKVSQVLFLVYCGGRRAHFYLDEIRVE